MKFRNKYSIKFKLKCLELVKILGIYRTSKILKIDKKCFKNWYLNEEQLQNMKEKNCFYRLPGGGKKIKFPEQEKKICLFILNCHEIGIKLNTNLIIEEYCRICTEMINYSKRTLRKWYDRFCKRNNCMNKILKK